jgi:hypothetical protein
MRNDFNDIANYDQIERTLRNLVQEGELIKVGYGIYTKARKNQMTGKVIPACLEGANAVIFEALKRLDVQITLGKATENIYLVNPPRFQSLLKLKPRVVLHANCL